MQKVFHCKLIKEVLCMYKVRTLNPWAHGAMEEIISAKIKNNKGFICTLKVTICILCSNIIETVCIGALWMTFIFSNSPSPKK